MPQILVMKGHRPVISEALQPLLLCVRPSCVLLQPNICLPRRSGVNVMQVQQTSEDSRGGGTGCKWKGWQLVKEESQWAVSTATLQKKWPWEGCASSLSLHFRTERWMIKTSRQGQSRLLSALDTAGVSVNWAFTANYWNMFCHTEMSEQIIYPNRKLVQLQKKKKTFLKMSAWRC